jgi:hypothetical protein
VPGSLFRRAAVSGTNRGRVADTPSCKLSTSLLVVMGACVKSRMSFHCPYRDALYELVKVEAGPETVDREIACRACGASFRHAKGNMFSNTSCCAKRDDARYGGGLPLHVDP